MAYVYITYSHRDRDFVDRLCADLGRQGIEVWVDRVQLRAGTDWTNEVNRAIEQADAILVVMSKTSIESSWVADEVDLAMHLRVTDRRLIMPLLIEDVEMPLRLGVFPYIDFRGEYQKGLNALIGRLPEMVHAAAPIAITEPKAKGYFFLSYAEEDTEFVFSMRKFLEERGYGYFDYQESERDYYGNQMFLELERQISQAAATFCILSPDWKTSQWTPKEFLFALHIKIPTFLLMAREMEPTLILEGIPYIDFVKDRQEGLAKLDRELRRKKLI